MFGVSGDVIKVNEIIERVFLLSILERLKTNLLIRKKIIVLEMTETLVGLSGKNY